MRKVCIIVLAIGICFGVASVEAKRQPYTCAEMRALSFEELKLYKKNVKIVKNAIKRWARNKNQPKQEQKTWVKKYTTMITIGMQSAAGFATIYSAFCK